MRLFRKRDDGSNNYEYHELTENDQYVVTSSETPQPVLHNPGQCIHFHQGSVTSASSQRIVPLPTTVQPVPVYTDQATQTSDEPSSRYFTVGGTSRGVAGIYAESAHASDDIELQIIAHDHVHRYPPGIIVIKTADEEGVEMIEEVSVAEERTRSNPRTEWERLNGTGLDEGAMEKLVGKFIDAVTRKTREWRSSPRDQ